MGEGMSIGLGIFLGSVYLGTVFLYVHTRDRWDWSSIVRRCLTFIGIAGVAVAVGFAGLAAFERWEARPKTILAVGAVTVGEPWSDVVFKLGEFRQEDIRSVRKHADEIGFRHVSLPISVFVRQGTVSYIVYHCTERAHPMPVNGVGCGDDGSKVYEKFGSKVRVLCHKGDDASVLQLRVFDVADYGTRYVMRSNKVTAIAVTQREELRSLVGYNWDRCSPVLDAKTSPAGPLLNAVDGGQPKN